MGISKTNLGVSVESIKNFIKAIAGTHNSIPGRDVADTHPITSITGLQDKMTIMDNISIAQKTVNTRGTKELLSEEYSYNLTPATTNGTAVLTAINSTITLKESILNYDTINIQLKINRGGVKISYPLFSYKTSSIVFNNSNTLNFADGSSMNINKIQGTTSAGAWGCFSTSFSFWFKDETHLFILNAGTPSTTVDWANVILSSIEGVNIENTTIDPVEYVNSSKGIEDSPVGHILSQMGKVAPNHYLICDGAIYNIVDYPYLSQYIKDQFGTFNFFGGDGITTFGLPDLRDEFLRGYHGDKIEKLSADIGMHQNATQHINFYTDASSKIYMDGEYGKYLSTQNPDSLIKSTVARGWTSPTPTNWVSASGNKLFTARPTNTTVLYCIKYEPTYFMSIQGIVQENMLFQGNVGTSSSTAVNNTIILNDSITNYDKIGISYYNYNINNTAQHFDYKEFRKDDLVTLIDNKVVNIYVSCLLGYLMSTAYTNILPANSTYTSIAVNQTQSFITKIIGIKYKTL